MLKALKILPEQYTAAQFLGIKNVKMLETLRSYCKYVHKEHFYSKYYCN